MSETKEIPLIVLNLCAKGHSLAEAWEIVNAPKGNTDAAETPADGEPKKLSAAEKKAALVPEFESLGAELPAESDSLAKWEQALTAAKEAAKTPGDDETADLM